MYLLSRQGAGPGIADVRSWISALAHSAESDPELRHVGRFSDFWILASVPGVGQMALRYVGGTLQVASTDDLPTERVDIAATPAGWRLLFEPVPKPLSHDLLAMSKHSPELTLGGSQAVLVRNLRVIMRLVDLGKALDVIE